jgi:hypothetical protein
LPVAIFSADIGAFTKRAYPWGINLRCFYDENSPLPVAIFSADIGAFTKRAYFV